MSWNSNGSQAVLIREERLKLLDRSLLLGDIVKKDPQSAMSGTVISTSTIVDIAPLGPVSKSVMAGRSSPYDLSITLGVRTSSRLHGLVAKNQILQNVPLEELASPHDYLEGNIIIHENWVGMVEEAWDEVAIRLSNGSVVVPEDTDELEKADPIVERFNVGDFARTKKGNLRRGLWKYGAYDPNIEPVGLVVQVRTVGLTVNWLCQRIDSDETFPEPPDYLEQDILESGKIHMYDRTRCQPSNDGASPFKVQGPNIHIGAVLKFKDLSGACVKYQPKSAGGPGIVRIPRTESLGYDLNVFEVISGRTEVVVQWQDMTTSTHSSIALFPDTDLDDENSAWPGEIICSNEGTPLQSALDDSPWGHTPKKVGVVQKVNSKERTAQVRWFPHADVLYTWLGDDPKSHLMPESKTGIVEGVVEEVSLYEVQSPTALNKRRGDLVVLQKSGKDKPLPGSEQPNGINWVGEVIDQGLDGLLTIRLGALDTVQDIKVNIENTILAYSNDMSSVEYNDGSSEEDSEYAEDDEDDEMEDATMDFINNVADSAAGEFIANLTGRQAPDLDQWHSHDYDPIGNRNFELESPGFDPDDLDNSDMEEDEEWTTEESDEGSETDSEAEDSGENASSINDDTPMTDFEPDEASKTLTPSNLILHVPPTPNPTSDYSSSSSSPTLDFLSLSNAPPSFAILSTPVPASHHYATSPTPTGTPMTHTRRIAKEHAILSSALPSGIYVRTWEARLDLLRILLVGPLDTPYELAPFVVDLWMGPTFPSRPPEIFFHSWATGTQAAAAAAGGVGGVSSSGTLSAGVGGGPGGAVNPNLYENGKICLSLLGTWHADQGGEAWSPGKSTVLQILVSLLGLVLVREPYYSESWSIFLFFSSLSFYAGLFFTLETLSTVIQLLPLDRD